METENGAKLAPLQQGMWAGRGAHGAVLGELDGLLGIHRDVGSRMAWREKRF